MTYLEPRIESIEREIQVLKFIENNEGLNHNSVLDIIVNQQNLMAKATFEKCIKNLIEKNIVEVEQRGNKKHYQLRLNYDHVHKARLERGTEILFHAVKKELHHIKDGYQHLSVDQKSQKMFKIISNCITISSGFTLVDSVKNPKKMLYRDEQIDIQQMINDAFRIMTEDKDFEHVYKVVTAYLLPSLSENYQELEKF